MLSTLQHAYPRTYCSDRVIVWRRPGGRQSYRDCRGATGLISQRQNGTVGTRTLLIYFGHLLITQDLEPSPFATCHHMWHDA